MQFLSSTLQFLRLDALTHRIKTAASAAAGLIAQAALRFGFKMRNTYRVECIGADGRLKWVEEVPNTVFDAGITDLLETYFRTNRSPAWYCGLVDNASWTTGYAAGDTSGSHGGWIESQAYSQGTRPAITFDAAASKSISNAGTKASFSINGTATIRGAFVINNSTKGGATGILYGAADFGTARSVVSGDTLNVQTTMTGA